MLWFGMFVLIIWTPVVYLIFQSMPAERAVVVSFVFAWLFLPTLQIGLSGLPDWSKMTATTTSVALIGYVKHYQRFASVRFRWFDLPVILYVITPIFSSTTTGQGLYDGVSSSVEELFRWGLPYLIGRAFLGNARGNYLLCLSLMIGGLIYAPLCLFEIRMSPMLKPWVYGFNDRGGLDFGLRYGGFRPIVFLSFGLETGWWMCCATLACYNLWRSGLITRVRGYPMATVTVGMAFVALACKSTGALLQIIIGFLCFGLARRFNLKVLVYLLIAIPPMYCVCRPLGIWSGQTLIYYSAMTFGADRAQSLAFRFDEEEIMMRNAMQKPIFGWARFGGFNLENGDGRAAVTDGLWIIVFGTMGGVGLACLNAMHLIPTMLFLRRFPREDWHKPEVAPTLTFAIILPLFMIDNLSNAMLNPIYCLAMGAVSGYIPQRGKSKRHRGGTSVTHGPPPLAISAAYRRALPQDILRDMAADEHEAAAVAAARAESNEEAWDLFSHCLADRQAAVDLAATPDRLDRLARSRVLFARFLTRIGYARFAIDARIQAVETWRLLRDDQQAAANFLPAYASNLNDLAWLVIAAPPSDPELLVRACLWAEEAVQVDPDHAPYWNTLGIGYYRQGEWYKTIRALSQSVQADKDGGNAFDFYYLALANHALNYRTPAQEWLTRADAWAASHPALAGPLSRVQDEVAQVLGAAKFTI